MEPISTITVKNHVILTIQNYEFLSLVLLDQCLFLSVNLSSLKLSSSWLHAVLFPSTSGISLLQSWKVVFLPTLQNIIVIQMIIWVAYYFWYWRRKLFHSIIQWSTEFLKSASLAITTSLSSSTSCRTLPNGHLKLLVSGRKLLSAPLKANFSQLCHIYHWSYHFLISQDLNFESFLIVSSPRITGPVTNILSIPSLQILSSPSPHISFYRHYCRQLTHLLLIRRYFQHCFCAMWAVYCSAWAFFSSSVRTSLVGLSCLEPSGIHRSNPYPLPRKADS